MQMQCKCNAKEKKKKEKENFPPYPLYKKKKKKKKVEYITHVRKFFIEVVKTKFEDMERTKIMVADYYGNPSYYSVMPKAIFDALELAYLKGENAVSVVKADFERMVSDYKTKMGV